MADPLDRQWPEEEMWQKRRRMPFRFVAAILITIFETMAVVALLAYLAYRIPYSYVIVILIQLFAAGRILISDHNPDYKIPWLVIVLVLPIFGFMVYFLYSSRKLPRKYLNRLRDAKQLNIKDDSREREALKQEDIDAYRQAMQICETSGAHVYRSTSIRYFDLGEKQVEPMLEDLESATQYILVCSFIVEKGVYWNAVLDVLKRKAAAGVDVKMMYDDLGCMRTLPGNYYKTLRSYGIDTVTFARLKGQANNEFNNRNHRKLVIIDGKIAYTGGSNLADEYVNRRVRFGHWKDNGVRLEGEAVREMTRMFLQDFALTADVSYEPWRYERVRFRPDDGFVIPFGCGPRPVYKERVGENTILNMLYQAREYVYITTPYLVVDNVMMEALENAAVRGIDVKIITPHIPDKPMVFLMTRSSYKRLLDHGVKIYEYEPGFIHQKLYVCDDEMAITGSINLDYRSLVHHFENGVWFYRSSVIGEMKKDFEQTLRSCIKIEKDTFRDTVWKRFQRAFFTVFAPLM